MVLIYGSFSTGKTTYLKNNPEINAVDTDIFYYMYTGAVKRDTFSYIDDHEAWMSMASIIQGMQNVSLVLTNNYGPINDVLGKFTIAFTSSDSRLEHMVSSSQLSTAHHAVLQRLIAREKMYLAEHATRIIQLQKDQYISTYAGEIANIIGGTI